MKHFLLRSFIYFAIVLGMSAVSWSVVADTEASKPVVKKVKKKKAVSCIRMSKKSLNHRARPYNASINKYAKKYNVDADLVKAVIAAESCYNRTAVSPKNAQGLMQLIPATASRFGVTNSFNADQNIRGGTRYLSFLLKRYKGNLYKAVASYNAGEGAVDRYKGIPPYRETQQYVRNVLQVYGKLSGKMIPVNKLGSNVRLNKNGRVSGRYESPFSGGKPGRGGLMVNKLKAPHLYKH
jgi:soluble lytic murein transglycosylase-like protein